MVIYTVKIQIDKTVEDKWFRWMSVEHIPEVINTGHFINYTFMKLLQNGIQDDRFSTYQLQYVCLDQQEYDAYRTNHAPKLQAKHLEKYERYLGTVSRSIYEDVTRSGQALVA